MDYKGIRVLLIERYLLLDNGMNNNVHIIDKRSVCDIIGMQNSIPITNVGYLHVLNILRFENYDKLCW